MDLAITFTICSYFMLKYCNVYNNVFKILTIYYLKQEMLFHVLIQALINLRFCDSLVFTTRTCKNKLNNMYSNQILTRKNYAQALRAFYYINNYILSICLPLEGVVFLSTASEMYLKKCHVLVRFVHIIFC